MKLLWLSDYPLIPIHGGASRVIFNQAKFLAQKGYDCTVLCRSVHSGSEAYQVINDIKINTFFVDVESNKKGILKSIHHSIGAFEALLKKEGHFDLIIGNQPMTRLGIMYSDASENIPQIYSYHTPFVENYLLGENFPILKKWLLRNYLRTLEKRALSQNQFLLFYSKYMLHYALRNYPFLQNTPCKVIPMGVDTEKFYCRCLTSISTIRKNLNIEANRPVALTVRNFVPQMGLKHLIDVWALVKNAIPNALLIIGGEGEEMNELKAYVQKLKLSENIKLAGYIPESQLPAYYEMSDLFIIPTLLLEGFGVVVLEALSSGVPVLGTRVGAIPEVLGPFNSSLLFSSRHRKVMAARISRFFLDKEWTKITPQKCHAYVAEKYPIQNHIEQLEQVIKQFQNPSRGFFVKTA